MNAVREFMHGLIDDAGIFPPEQLSLDAAVDRHIEAQSGTEDWILGRFVARSTSVGEIGGGAPFVWQLTVVVDHSSVHDGFVCVRAAHDRADAIVESVEIPLSRGKGATTASRLSDLATQLVGAGLGDTELFVECALDSQRDIDETVAAIATAAREQGVRLLAKVRCGGDSVPSSVQLTQFIVACLAHRVAFKATAGLHHAIASRASNGTFAHGFLNVAGAAVLATRGGLDEAQLLALIDDGNADNFRLDATGFAWKTHAAAPTEISAARRTFRSFGSCSLSEPLEELRRLGILEGAAF